MAKPFLKWAGGKKWFVNQERDRLLLDFNRYIEPFLGGGSVFFYINPQQAMPLMVALTLVIIKRLSIDSIHFLKVVLRQSKMNAKQNGR